MLHLIGELRVEVERLKAVAPIGPIVRHFEDEEEWEDTEYVKCEVCGAMSDCSPCDLCCQEGYVKLDEDGVVVYENDAPVILKKYEKKVS
jgi:hypothetical protein